MAVQSYPFTPGQACTLWTPAGPLPYWVGAPDTAGSAYGESFTEGAGSSIKIDVYVNWDDAGDFKTYALGFSDGVLISPPPPPPPPPPPGVPPLAGVPTHLLTRVTPLLCPWTDGVSFCYLEELNEMSVGGGHEPDPGMPDFWPRAGYVRYEAIFRQRPYALMEDKDLSNGADRELYRYVKRTRKWNPRERRVNQYALETLGGQRLAEVGFVPFIGVEYEYVWRMVPCKYINVDAINDCLLHVNDALFDVAGGKTFGLNAVTAGPRCGNPFAAKTLLFDGFTRPSEPYRMPNGEYAEDLSLHFSFNPNTWNYVPQADGTWVEVRFVGSHLPLYPTADLNRVFTLRVA